MTTLLDLLKGVEAALGSEYTTEGYDAESIRPVVRIIQRCFDEIAGPGTFVVRMMWEMPEFGGDSQLVAMSAVDDNMYCWDVPTPFGNDVDPLEVETAIGVIVADEDDPDYITPLIRLTDDENGTWDFIEPEEDPAPAPPPRAGAYFIHPECGRDDRWGPVLGPFPDYLQITYREIRNGAEDVIAWLGDDGDWHIKEDDQPYSDLVIWHEGAGPRVVIEDGKFVIFQQSQ